MGNEMLPQTSRKKASRIGMNESRDKIKPLYIVFLHPLCDEIENKERRSLEYWNLRNKVSFLEFYDAYGMMVVKEV